MTILSKQYLQVFLTQNAMHELPQCFLQGPGKMLGVVAVVPPPAASQVYEGEDIQLDVSIWEPEQILAV